MTIKSIARAIKQRKPAIIRERGEPRYVLLDWQKYQAWKEMEEDLEDSTRLAKALVDPKNQKRVRYERVRKTLNLP